MAPKRSHSFKVIKPRNKNSTRRRSSGVVGWHRSILFNYTTTWLSFVKDVMSGGNLEMKLTRKSLVASMGYGGFGLVFNDIKVLKIKVQYRSEVSVTQVGSYVLNICDESQVATDEYDYLINAPGSTCRRAYHGAETEWFPTEPSDRDFGAIGDTSTIAVLRLIGSDSTTSKLVLRGRILISAHVTFRGRADKQKVRTRARKILEEIEEQESEERLLASFSALDRPSIEPDA